MCTAGFGEPWAFSLRARRLLAARRGDFDLVHDNQCLGSGMLGMLEDGWPLLTTLHHPITVDRELALGHADQPLAAATPPAGGSASCGCRCGWPGGCPAIVTVSESSRTRHRRPDGRAGGADDRGPGRRRPHRLPAPARAPPRCPGRLMVTSSSDVPMKGLVPLLEAVAKLRTERDGRAGRHRPAPDPAAGWTGPSSGSASPTSCAASAASPTTSWPASYGEAQVAVVPSLYEGFSLPAIEAMACGVPVVATTGGALPEVVGPRRRDRAAGPARRPGRPGRRPSAACSTTPPCAARLGDGRPRSGCWTASPGRSRPRGRPSATGVDAWRPRR